MEERGVLVWWVTLSAVALVNLALWVLSARSVRRSQGADAPYRRRQLLLSGLFVLGCATRSWIPRADVQRITTVDSFAGCVLVGRSIATVAELAFVAQWALLLGALAERARSGLAAKLARVFVPVIAVAETCSWCAVLTTNYLGNAFEESLWTLTAALLVAGFLSLFSSADRSLRSFLRVGVALGLAYVAFMSLVDVPMYVTRWRSDEAASRVYLSLADGFADAQRWIVTRRWDDWRDEMPWMSLYFSVAVWMSLSLVHLPRLPERAPES
jgi:hypothetical protein